MAPQHARAPREVFEDHLEHAEHGTVEADLHRNCSSDGVVLCELGASRGRACAKQLAKRLEQELPLIVAQTIHYTIVRDDQEHRAEEISDV